MNLPYRTVRNEAICELIEKKSRFISHIKRVETEKEALDFLNEIRAEHRTATHNVYAYILRENNTMRYSDDGEPSGTSGMPTLDVLRKEDLTDCIIVTTRYFGGTHLGTGGLVHAYGKAAKDAVDAAGILPRAVCRQVSISIGYTQSGKIEYAIAASGFSSAPPEYGETVTYRVTVPLEKCDDFCADITEKSFGEAKISLSDEGYMDC